MIDKDDALKIAASKHGPDFKAYQVFEGVPDHCALYGSFPRGSKDVWCILADNYPKLSCSIIGSSRAIVISKATGAVLYDGNAGNEG